MRILVVGSNGLLGGNVLTVARNRGHSVVGTYHSEKPTFDCPQYRLDLTNSADCKEIIRRAEPDGVINCAAMTDVDGCESNPDQAYEVNAEGAGHLAKITQQYGASFVHTSTDYVFDGERSTPYTESVDPNPRQVYGKSKLAGESAVRDSHDDAIIARLSFVYGRSQPRGELSGFPAWVRETVASGESTPLFTDQHITPSHAGNTAKTLLDLLHSDATETFNVTCRSCVTPYEFGEALLKAFNLPTDRIEEGSMSAVDRPAPRPRYTCLNVDKIERTLGREQPTLSEAISTLI